MRVFASLSQPIAADLDARMRDFAVLRLETTPARVLSAVLVAGAFGAVYPQVWVVIWLTAVLLLSALEQPAYRAVVKRDGPLRRIDVIRAIGTSTAIAAVMSAPTPFLMLMGDPVGVGLGSLLVAACLLHAFSTTARLGRLGWCLGAPHALQLVLAPLALMVFGPETPYAITLTICAVIYLFHLRTVWLQIRRQQVEVEAARDLAMARQAEAEAQTEAKSRFLAMVSHEIRTPLNTIMGANQLLARAPLADGLQGHVEVIRAAGQSMVTVLNDVLDFSKIEAGKLEINAEEVDLHQLIAGVVSVWEPAALTKGLGLRKEMTYPLPRAVVVDGNRLRQVLYNLVSNAVKFTSQGQITLEVRWTADAEGVGQLAVTVRDTGPGLSAEAQTRLFQPFVQAGHSQTEQQGGTGLGLVISRRLAELMGGSLTLQSETGKGASFTVTVAAPEVVVPVADSAPPEGPTIPPPGLKVLVAEDHPVNRRLLSLLLAPFELDLTLAENGLEALDQLRVAPFDLILMDIEMPVMGGIDAVRALRAEPGPNQRTPVLALTANAMVQQQRDYAAAGMQGHVSKPIHLPTLAAAMAHAVDHVPEAPFAPAPHQQSAS